MGDGFVGGGVEGDSEKEKGWEEGQKGVAENVRRDR